MSQEMPITLKASALTCPVCSGIFVNPCETSCCKFLVCNSCRRRDGDNDKCPGCCGTPFSWRTSHLADRILANCNRQCKFCKESITLGDMGAHHDTSCEKRPFVCLIHGCGATLTRQEMRDHMREEHSDFLMKHFTGVPLTGPNACGIVRRGSMEGSLAQAHEPSLRQWFTWAVDLQCIYDTPWASFTCEDFHGQCDNRGATMVLVSTTGNSIFGGYTPALWNDVGGPPGVGVQFEGRDKTFIFSLRDSRDRVPFRIYLPAEYSSLGSKVRMGAITCNRLLGPVFGGAVGWDTDTPDYPLWISTGHCKQRTSDKCTACNRFNDGGNQICIDNYNGDFTPRRIEVWTVK